MAASGTKRQGGRSLRTSRIGVAAAAAFTLLVPGGAFADATVYRGNPEGTGVYQATGLPQLGGAAWKVRVEGRGHFPPAVGDGVLVVGRSVFPGLVALDAKTGKPLWEARGVWVCTTPVIADGLVIFAFGNGTKKGGGISAADLRTGKRLWTFATRDTETASPVYDGEHVYLTSVDGYLYALEARTGKERWRCKFSDPPGSGGPLAISARTGYFGGKGHHMARGGKSRLYAIDLATGEIRWELKPLFDPRDKGLGVDVSGVPAIVGGTVYFATASERFYAVDAGTGAVRWSFKAEGRVTEPAVAEGLVFFGTNRRQVYALDADSGRQVWKLEVEGGASPPSFAAGILYFGGGATSRTGLGNYLYAVEARTGRILWRYETDQPSPGKPGMARWGLTAPVVVDGGVFFTCWTFAYRLR